jgi:predicted nucleic acid-binding protein
LSNFYALLDANVLYNASVRDTLLRAFEENLYRAYWSSEILDEATRNLIADGRMTPLSAQTFESLLHTYFPEAFVSGYSPLIQGIGNDPKDRHVVAAAIQAHAQVIVTFNLRHFPSHILSPFGIDAQHPDVFLQYLYELHPTTMIRIIKEQAADLTRPPKPLETVLHTLREHVPTFIDAIEHHLAQDDAKRSRQAGKLP